VTGAPDPEDGDPFVLIVSSRSDEVIAAQLLPDLAAYGRLMRVVATGADARIVVEQGAVTGVMVDPELPDMNPYDLCAWVRARFRDLPLMVLDEDEVDLKAVHLSPGGGVWTISASLRERMTDASVLHGVLDTSPPADVEWIAEQTGHSVEETEEDFQSLRAKLGCASHAEMLFKLRNLPRDADEIAKGADMVVRFEPGPIPEA